MSAWFVSPSKDKDPLKGERPSLEWSVSSLIPKNVAQKLINHQLLSAKSPTVTLTNEDLALSGASGQAGDHSHQFSGFNGLGDMGIKTSRYSTEAVFWLRMCSECSRRDWDAALVLNDPQLGK